MNSEAVTKKRIAWIDWIRALAIIFVIVCHCTELVYPLNASNIISRDELSQIFSFSCFTIGRIGVPLFLFMSGFLLLDRYYSKGDCINFWKKKWLGILIAIEIWFVIYNIVAIAFAGYSIDIARIVKNMLFLEPLDVIPHTWYIPMILGLYLLMPIMANGLKKLDDAKILEFPLIFFIVLLFVLPVINAFLGAYGIEELSCLIPWGFSGGEYGCYMLLGYCFKKGLFSNISKGVSAIILLASLACAVSMQIFLVDSDAPYYIWYNNFFLLSCGFGLFQLFSKLKVQENKAISALSKYSFAIYLAHYPVVLLMIRLWHKALYFIPAPLYLCLSIVSVAIISLLVCIAINRIPKVGKVMLYMR